MSHPTLQSIGEERLHELVDRLDTRGPRYTSYPTAPVWKNDLKKNDYPELLSRLSRKGRAVALYLHFPYCRQRCLYCGCNSFITNEAGRIGTYAESLKKEIDLIACQTGGSVQHSWLHLGGGTPTHQTVKQLEEVLTLVLKSFPAASQFERSVEVDPRITTREQLELFAALGFKRISAGLQDLDPAVQKAVHREYTFDQIAGFVETCRALGFDGINIDLIYGLPFQTRASWADSLRKVASLRPDRLATFGYAHLPDKIKHQAALREEDMPSPRDRLGMLLDANQILQAEGYVGVGLDHFALPTDRLARARQSGTLWRNFMGYTDISGLEMIGLGASAIGEFDEMFVQNQSQPEKYQSSIESGFAVNRGHILTTDDRVRKLIINDLMCNLRIRIPVEAEIALNGSFARLHSAMRSLSIYQDEGLIEPEGDGYLVTPVGQLFVRNLAMAFDSYLDSSNVTYSRTV